MATTNHERVGKALELLKAGLGPFVDREIQTAVKAQRIDAATLRRFVDNPLIGDKPATEWDVAALLKLMWETWNDVFRTVLGRAERNFVSELRDHRNNWAHQRPFSGDDAYRALDTTNRLLTAVSAPQAAEVEKLKMELLRVRYDEQARGERRKQASLAIESAAVTLKPWREVVTPHQDVASGRYQQAEFAADLQQASKGDGPPMSSQRAFSRVITGVAERPAVGDSILPQWGGLYPPPPSPLPAQSRPPAACSGTLRPSPVPRAVAPARLSAVACWQDELPSSFSRTLPFRPGLAAADQGRTSIIQTFGAWSSAAVAARSANTRAAYTSQVGGGSSSVVREAAAPRPAAGDAGDVFLSEARRGGGLGGDGSRGGARGVGGRAGADGHALEGRSPAHRRSLARNLTAEECDAVLAACCRRRRTGRSLEREETAMRRSLIDGTNRRAAVSRRPAPQRSGRPALGRLSTCPVTTTSSSPCAARRRTPAGDRADVRRAVGGSAAVRRLHAARSPTPTESVIGLAVHQINRRFAAAYAAAGLEGRRTSHSGRVGLAVELTVRGASTHDIQIAGGWRNAGMVARYAASISTSTGAVSRFMRETKPNRERTR